MSIHLSEKESLVLAAARLDAEQTIPQLARITGLKQTTVQHVMRELIERKIITRFALFNVSLLGYQEYDVTGALALRGDSARKQFFDFLRSSPCVSFILETGGSYHCAFTICAKSPVDADLFVQEIGKKFGFVFSDDGIVVSLRYTIYSPKYLTTKKLALRSVEIPALAKSVTLDPTDTKILRAMSAHPEKSIREIAALTGFPHSTVNYRIRAYKKSGLFAGYLWAIHPRLFGYQHFRVNVSLRGVDPNIKKSMAEFALNHPNVNYLHEWFGEWNYCMGITSTHVDVAAAVVNEIYDAFGAALRRVVLFPVVEGHKISFFPFGEKS